MKLQYFSPAVIKLDAKSTGLSVRPLVQIGQVFDPVGYLIERDCTTYLAEINSYKLKLIKVLT